MAVRFADSFQHYNDTTLKYSTPGGVFNAVAPLRHGTQNLKLTSVSSPVYSFVGLGVTLAGGIVGLAWRAGHLSGRVFSLRSGGVDQVWVALHADGSLSVETSLGTLGTSAAGVVALNTWYYIALKMAIDAVAGSAVLRLTVDATNTMTELVNVSGVDTDPVASLSFDSVAFGGPTSSFAWIQDVVIQETGTGVNDDFLGAAYVNAVMPIADGDQIESNPTPWQPGLPHFSRVNEVPPDGGATVISVQENVLGANVSEGYHYDFSTLPALPIASVQSVADSNDVTLADPPSIFGVGMCIALISVPATFVDLQPKRNGVFADGVFFMDVINANTNPITGLAWTAADLLDIQIGSHFADIV